MSDTQSLKQTTAADVRGIVGSADDLTIARIVATGATTAEVLEAYTWVTADDRLGPELHRQPSGRVAELCEILCEEEPDDHT